MKSRGIVLLVGALLACATAYWTDLVFAAHHSSTHDIGSTSQLGAFHDLLFGSGCILVFAATGISLWRHRIAALIVRILVAVLSVAGIAFILRAFLDFHAMSSSSTLRPVPFIVGLLLLFGYFVATFFTALPVVSVQRAFRLRFVLHFGIFPAALCVLILVGYPRDFYFTFSAFGLYLLAGLPFVLLSFHMYALRQAFEPSA
jgi:hypothetical protein